MHTAFMTAEDAVGVLFVVLVERRSGVFNRRFLDVDFAVQVDFFNLGHITLSFKLIVNSGSCGT